MPSYFSPGPKLKVWQRAHELVLKCYRITATFPKTEVYGLVDQIKRAAYSVPSNIVEGQSRNTTKEYRSRSRLNPLIPYCV